MRYIKHCKLPSCNKTFQTNRKWQEFCKIDHRKEYWRLYRYSENQVRRELKELRKEQEKMKVELERLA